MKKICSGERGDNRKAESRALQSLRSLGLFSASSVLNPETLDTEVTEERQGSQRVQETIFVRDYCCGAEQIVPKPKYPNAQSSGPLWQQVRPAKIRVGS